LGLPLGPSEDARAAATCLASALDGPDGLLAKALGAGLARSFSARVLGGPRARALVVSIATAPGTLDAAVAQTRALLDRLRQGAFTDADRARAVARTEKSSLAAALDPRTRTIALFRGEAPFSTPSLETVRAFAARSLRDDALVIVAVRPKPPRPP
jgi:hypothetical protein